MKLKLLSRSKRKVKYKSRSPKEDPSKILIEVQNDVSGCKIDYTLQEGAYLNYVQNHQ